MHSLSTPLNRTPLLSQAKELYSGRAGIHMDTARLLHGVSSRSCPSGDDADFCSQMDGLLHPDLVRVPVGGPPDVSELMHQLSRGSSATALEELPRVVLRHVPGCGLAALVEMLRPCTRLSCFIPSGNMK